MSIIINKAMIFVIPSYSIHYTKLYESIRSIQKQLKDLDKAIERVLDGIQGAQCLLSVPGIGKVYAAGLLGDRITSYNVCYTKLLRLLIT